VNREQLVYLYTKRGRSLELGNQLDEALRNYNEMERLAHEHNNRALELAALLARATLRSTPTRVHDAAQGQSLSEQALTLARELEDLQAQAKALWNLMLLSLNTGHADEAIAYGEQSLTIRVNETHRYHLYF
jgi:tetratricopeptide (TPR) repeat protein